MGEKVKFNLLLLMADLIVLIMNYIIFQVKINQRMPGKGMAIQILINSEGKENVC
jgi:hypothetical protein